MRPAAAPGRAVGTIPSGCGGTTPEAARCPTAAAVGRCGGRPGVGVRFYRGLAIGLPVSLALWAAIIWAVARLLG